jgi:hypothetical protein
MEIQERVIKNALLIVHQNDEVYEVISRCVSDACGDVTSEQAFRDCVRAVSVVRVLISVNNRGVKTCPIVWRLLSEELLGKIEKVNEYLEGELNAAANRLGLTPEEVEAIVREVEGSIGDGEPFASRILNTISGLAKRRVRAREFAGYVRDAVIDESSDKLVIHIVIPDGKPESFDITIKRDEIGHAYLVGRELEVWVTDLARGERYNKHGKAMNGNVRITIPRVLMGSFDRFMRHGLVPDFSTVEFFEAIRDRLEVIKTPEERLREAVGNAFAKFVWVPVIRKETGAHETESDLTGEPQAYAYLLPDEIWLPYYLWGVLRSELEKYNVLETSVRAWIKKSRTSRSITRKWDGREIVIRNLVILDRARVEEALGGSVEDFIVHSEKPVNDWDVGGEA